MAHKKRIPQNVLDIMVFVRVMHAYSKDSVSAVLRLKPYVVPHLDGDRHKKDHRMAIMFGYRQIVKEIRKAMFSIPESLMESISRQNNHNFNKKCFQDLEKLFISSIPK